MHDIVYVELFASRTSRKGISPESMSRLGAALSAASVIIKIGVNYLSSCAFSSGVPPYPYKMKHAALSSSPSASTDSSSNVDTMVEAEAGEALKKASEEMPWVKFCMVASSCIAQQSEWVISGVYVVEPQASKYWKSGLAIPELMSQLTKSAPLEPEVGELLGALMDYLFNCWSLLSVVSVDISPVMKYCRPSDENLEEGNERIETTVDASGVRSLAADVFLRALRDMEADTILLLLEMLLEEDKQGKSKIQHFPVLCISLMSYMPMWGYRVWGHSDSGVCIYIV